MLEAAIVVGGVRVSLRRGYVHPVSPFYTGVYGRAKVTRKPQRSKSGNRGVQQDASRLIKLCQFPLDGLTVLGKGRL